MTTDGAPEEHNDNPDGPSGMNGPPGHHHENGGDMHHDSMTGGGGEDSVNDASSPHDQNNDVIGSAALRPVFLGNLKNAYASTDVTDIFNRPIPPPGKEGIYKPLPVDRIDLKRGYCFVFLKDVASQADKELAERFVSDINGMEVPNLSIALRAEFARGDGRIKRKEDDRRRNIQPSETLFVVNFHEETTKREDLQMLFEPYGELVRIDMKRNYAFVQFRTIEQATRAKNFANGGKLDQSVLTVEFVARQRGEQDRGPGGRGRDSRGGRRDDGRGGPGGGDRYRTPSDRRGGPRGGGPDRYSSSHDRYDSRGGGGNGDRHDRGGGGWDRYDDMGRDDTRGRRDRSPGGYRGGSPVGGGSSGGYRGRSPPAYRGGSPGRGGGGGGFARRSRSRSRSPRGYRSRSPPRGGGGGRYDDRDRGAGGGRHDDYRDGGGRRSPIDHRDRGRGSPERELYRGGGRDDRGYRP